MIERGESIGKVLVVDGNSQSVDVLAVRLVRRDYTVSKAYRGSDALISDLDNKPRAFEEGVWTT